MKRPKLGATVVAICAAVVLTACGGDSDGGKRATAQTPAAEGLLDLVPPDRAGIRFVDLTAIRADLGLPPDADAADEGGGSGAAKLAEAARTVIPYLSLARPRPIEGAIDHGAITAAAGNLTSGPSGVTALATEQPFEDIAQRLVVDGYELDGDVLESDSSFVRGSYSVVADAGEGAIVLGYGRPAVERAIEDTPGAQAPARALVEDIDGTLRGAILPHAGCIAGIAVGESGDLAGGEIVIDVGAKPSPQRFRLPDSIELSEYEFDDVHARADTITAAVGIDPQAGSIIGPIALLDTNLAPDEIYAC